jgi:hypothetical protein
MVIFHSYVTGYPRVWDLTINQWIGLLGKILTGNPLVLTIKLIGLSG